MSKLDALREAQIWMFNHPDKIWDEETYAALRGDAVPSSNRTNNYSSHWNSGRLFTQW